MQMDFRISKERETNSSIHRTCMKDTLSANIQTKSKELEIQEETIRKTAVNDDRQNILSAYL